MRLKTYRAGSVVQAMAMIRAELGADALILHSRRVSGGVEIAAGLEHEDEEPSKPAPLPPPDPAPQTRQTRPRWQPRPIAPANADTLNRLAWHGIPACLAADLAATDLARGLADHLHFGTLPLSAEAPLLLAGAPGAGKTLTIARLATRLVLGGHMPLVISADGRRAGAAEELAAYTRLLGLELIVANKPAMIVRALPHRAPGAPVLIDTAGLNPFDPAQVEALCALASAAGAQTVLVLAAGQDAQEAAEQAEIFAACDVHHFIPTRLDMARRLGAVVLAAHAGSLTLSEAGTGPGATDGLSPLTPATLCDWLSKPAPAQPTRQANHASPRRT